MSATTPFTAAERILLPYLTDTAVRQRAVRVSDGALGQTTTWEEAEFACLMDETLSGTETEEAGSLGSVRFFRMAFARGTDILPADRLVKDGLPYEVIETNAGQTTAALLSVEIVRLR
jgi:hypothetical protein